MAYINGKEIIFSSIITQVEGSNQGIAQGFATQIGAKAFPIVAIDRTNKTFTLDSVEGLEVGDVYTVDLSYYTDNDECGVSLFADYGKITNISGTTITVDTFPENAKSLRNISEDESMDEEDNTFRIVLKPDVGTKSIGKTAFAMGYETQAHTRGSVAFGLGSVAAAGNSFSVGVNNYTSGYSAIALGKHNVSSGYGTSVAIGNSNTSSGEDSVAIGKSNKATNKSSVAIGIQNTSSGANAVAVGYKNVAEGQTSFASGSKNTAKGLGASVMGINSIVSGDGSFSAGSTNEVTGKNAMALGLGLITSGARQLVSGRYNIADENKAVIVGNGGSASNRNNAYTLDWNGNGWFKGDIYFGGTSQDDATSLGKTLGDIETALDTIIAIQNSLIGGDA